MALQTYRAKRNFAVTPEPRGAPSRAKAAGHQYVIQKHAARRLHYDLRLELDGVMKSWAVTRGPSLVPGEKRLAVEVEDHPIEYNEFEGIIPEGQYGGGTVMIWDSGRWQPDGDPHKGLEKGHLDFELDGEKLHGRWHLVRMRGRPRERRTNWLLIKAHDEAARTERDPDILEEMPLSAISGRSIPEIAEGKGRHRVWHSNRSVKENVRAGATRGATSAGAGRTAKARPRARASEARNAKAPRKAKGKRKGSAARGAPLPDFVPPCLATPSEKAPDVSGWVHEIKFDGYRIQARLEDGEVRLLTRKALDGAERFRPVAAAIAELPAAQALLDGEIVSRMSDGTTSFSQLQQDLADGRDDRLVYFVFDLLHLDGRDLTPEALIARKEVLQRWLDRLPRDGPLMLSEHFDEKGSVLLEHARRLGLEGIISKRRDAPYHSGRTGDWLKVKCRNRQELVVTGYAPSTVDSKAIGALILGHYDHGQWRYAGRAGTGYTHKVARELWSRLQPLRTDKPPFPLPPEERASRNAHWVEPRLVVEVDFHGWTHGDRVRQASFQGVRDDKSPKKVVREVNVMPPASKPAAAAPARRAAKTTGRAASRAPAARSSAAKVTGRQTKKSAGAASYTVLLTHPDRVYWEDVGVTKQGLADYYATIWDWMRPHVVGRPLALVRCPEGASRECFFQKHASAGIDEKRLRLVREPDGDHVITIDDLDGLISLAQAGVLEVHTRGTIAESLETCDRLVFDLDPGPGTEWTDIAAAAREVRRRLGEIELAAYLKTSGGKGLHVVVPIAPVPWDTAKAFARGIAEGMAADEPSRYTATVKKSSRQKRIFVDYMRNSREATAVAPFSTRARPGAPVSAPIGWEELRSLTSASHYNVLNLPQRLARLRKDPWSDIGKRAQKLPNG